MQQVCGGVTYTCGSPDIYTLSPRALGVYIRQTTHAHGITIKYKYV